MPDADDNAQAHDHAPPSPFPVTLAPEELARFRRAPDGRFVNLDGWTSPAAGDVFQWAVVDWLAGRRRKSPAHADVPAVAPDRQALARPPAAGEGARLTWLGHATWLVQMGGVSLLVDPILNPRIFGGTKRNVAAPLAAADMPPIAAQLVTHNHYDHMDMPSLRATGAPVLAGLGTARLTGGRPPVTELGWWDSAEVGGARVTFVPSQHWSRRTLADTNRALWGGFVIEAGGVAVYHSGDTARFDGFRDIGRRFPRLDAALLPIGAYDPTWFMSRQHMGPDDALDALEALGARSLLAMHWGTFKLTDEPLDEPPRRLREGAVARGIDERRARVLAVGESVTIAPAR